MADTKFTDFSDEGASVDVTDWIVGLYSSDNARFQVQDITKRVQLDTGGGYAYNAGQLSYDAVSKTGLIDTGFSGVRVNVGQELHIRFYNNCGFDIDNGQVINVSGVDGTNLVVSGCLADASSPATSLSVIGIATADVLDGEVGVATIFGEIRDFDTSGLSAGVPVYLSELVAGGLTNTRPTYPNTPLLVGTCLKSDATTGIVFVNPQRITRAPLSRSYSFSSQGVGSGSYWRAGFYDWATTSITLNQGSTTQTYGTVGETYAAHASIVASAAGTVDTGQVGLRVTGIKDSETGTQTAAQTDIITEDITTLTANEYAETAGKFSGQITFELYVVSGSPTTYSLTFNYGYSKYEDFGNSDFTISGVEAVWLGAANDSSADIILYKHATTGWTYAASGFVAGDGIIARKSVDQSLAGNIVNGKTGAWKCVDLDEFIEGSGSEGVLIKVVTGQNNTFQSMNIHLSSVSEELY